MRELAERYRPPNGLPARQSTNPDASHSHHTAELQRRIAIVEAAFDVDGLISESLTQKEIAGYYKHSALGYRWVHSRAGAMHMAINPDGAFAEHGYYGQAQAVEHRFTHDTSTVLELAIGNGFNIAYLAERHRQVTFTGIDLVSENVRRAHGRTGHLENVDLRVGDFHSLPFADASFDLVFVIEALCHAIDMPRALTEVFRVLRPGGRLIVIDGWRTGCFSELPRLVRRAATLVERAMSVADPWTLPRWRMQVKQTGLRPLEDVDYSAAIMPSLERLERVAATYFRHPLIAGISRRLLPQALLRNAIAGYLMPLTVAAGAHTYRLVDIQR